MKHLLTFLTLIIIATPLAHAQTFPDVPYDHPYREAIEDLSRQGIISGHADGTYKPEDTINRAAIAKILIEATEDEADITGSNCAPDVGTQWFAKYVCRGMELGYWKGYPDGNFYPEKPVSFIEMAKMISVALIKSRTIKSYQYPKHEEGWHVEYVRELENRYAIPRNIDNLYYQMNRGQVAQVIWKLQYSSVTKGKCEKKYEFAEPEIRIQQIPPLLCFENGGYFFSNDEEDFVRNYKTGLLKDADPYSFQVLAHDYGTDHDFVYYRNQIIQDANKITFNVIDQDYSRDKTNIYHRGEKTPLNPDSFEMLEFGYAKDDKLVVHSG